MIYLSFVVATIACAAAALSALWPTPLVKRVWRGTELVNQLSCTLVLLEEQYQRFLLSAKSGATLMPMEFSLAKKLTNKTIKILDELVENGEWGFLFPNKKHAVLLHTRFLASAEHALESGDDVNEWTKQHFMFGLYRLVGQCCDYKHKCPSELIEIYDRVKGNGLLDTSWNYLDTLAEGQVA